MIIKTKFSINKSGFLAIKTQGSTKHKVGTQEGLIHSFNTSKAGGTECTIQRDVKTQLNQKRTNTRHPNAFKYIHCCYERSN